MKRSWMLPTIATAQDGSRNPIATAIWGTTVSRLGGCIWASFKNLNHRPEIVQSHNQHYSTSDPTPSSIFKRQLEQLRWMLLQHPATSWPFQLVLPTPGRQKELPHGISQNCGTHDDMSLSNRWRIHLFPLWVSGGTGQQVDTITIMRTGRTLNHKVAHAVQDFGSSWPCGIFHAIDIQ